MTNEQAIEVLKHTMWKAPNEVTADKIIQATGMAIQALSQDCTDAVSRELSAKDYLDMADRKAKKIKDALTVTQKSGKCKNCKYFEYDSVAKVDGVPLIVAHEICNKWGDGCKTKEDGYCFLFEPQESEDKE